VFERAEPVRRAVSRLPLSVLYWLSFSIAGVGYPARSFVPLAISCGFARRFVNSLPSHLKYYAAYPFRVYKRRWVDRLSAPAEILLYTAKEARALLEGQGLEAVTGVPYPRPASRPSAE